MSTQVFGIIAPHPPIMVQEVGHERASVTRESAAAMAEAATVLRAYNPDTVVIMSPHSPPMADAFVVETADRVEGSLAQFGAADVALHYDGDPELAEQLLTRLDEAGIPAVERGAVPVLESGVLDHGVLVPMTFLDPTGRWPLLVLSLSYLPYADHARLGHEVAAAAVDLGRKIAFVASGDCSHRLTPDAPAGFSPHGAELDRRLVELIGESDFDGLSHIDPEIVDGGGECGLRSFITLGGAADPARARVLAYEGPWGVGYLTALVNEDAARPGTRRTTATETPVSGAKGGAPGLDRSSAVKLARRAIEAYVREGVRVDAEPLADPELPARAGAFVSLHRGGQLRGCIGTIEPVSPTLAEEIVRNAIEAAVHDPRFEPLGKDELDDLDVKVDVLHEPESAQRADLDPARYGVICTSGYRRGLLLPDLEGIDTVDQQVSIACRKGGIGSGDPVELERFRVDRYV